VEPKRVVQTSERVRGKEHPDTLISIYNLAMLYQAQGRYGEAEPLAKRALEGLTRVLEKNHPNTRGAANSLAKLKAAMAKRKQ
jgi:hypothetical protein